VIEAPLLGQRAYFVIRTPEVTDENTLKKFADRSFDHRRTATLVDYKITPFIGGKAPEPMGDAADPSAGLIGIKDSGMLNLFSDILVKRL
jgi:hypothetical protein